MEQIQVDFIINFLKNNLNAKKSERTKKQVELNCLSGEIDNLEDMLFKIERELDRMQGETK